MYENFTEQSKEVVRLAEEEARNLSQSRIDTEHLLLALIRHEDGREFSPLTASGISLQGAREQAVKIKGRRGQSPVSIPKTAQAEEVLTKLAVLEAHRLGDTAIKTGHILLALLRDYESNALTVLNRLGVNRSGLRQQVLQFLQQRPPGLLVSLPGNQQPDPPRPVSPKLSRIGRDLVQEIRDHSIEATVGREQEIEQIIHVLARRTGNSPLLVGEDGVGKTSTVLGLAAAIAAGQAGPVSDYDLYALDFDLLARDVSSPQEFRGRLLAIAGEAQLSSTLLFVDELDEYVRPDESRAGFEPWPILKSLLLSGAVQIVGTVTGQSGRNLVLSSPAVERAMHVVDIDEPSVEETIEILNGKCARLEDHHDVTFTDEAVRAAAELALQHREHAHLPAAAIDLLDEAAAYARVRMATASAGDEMPGARLIIGANIIKTVVNQRAALHKARREPAAPTDAPAPHPAVIDGDESIWSMV